jgi:hypothetical protein
LEPHSSFVKKKEWDGIDPGRSARHVIELASKECSPERVCNVPRLKPYSGMLREVRFHALEKPGSMTELGANRTSGANIRCGRVASWFHVPSYKLIRGASMNLRLQARGHSETLISKCRPDAHLKSVDPN